MNYQDISGLAPYEQWAADKKAELDIENVAILAARQTQLDARTVIDVGDFVIDGEKILRVAHDWGDSVQLSDGRFGASFYLGDGYLDFSGGLDPSIEKNRFSLTDERREGAVWFFSQNRTGAHNGYHTNATFRVWALR
jgi:hypothetical protein